MFKAVVHFLQINTQALFNVQIVSSIGRLIVERQKGLYNDKSHFLSNFRNQLTFDYENNKTICSYNNPSFEEKWLEIKTTISNLTMAAVPLCVVIPTNLAIVVKMLLQRKKRQRLGATFATNEATKVTIMTLSVTVVYIILLLPMSIYIILSDGGRSNYHILVLLANLPYLNMSLNFYLYFLSGKMFREETIKMLKKLFSRSLEVRETTRRSITLSTDFNVNS